MQAQFKLYEMFALQNKKQNNLDWERERERERKGPEIDWDRSRRIGTKAIRIGLNVN